MKNYMKLILAVCLMAFLYGCGSSNKPEPAAPSTEPETQPEATAGPIASESNSTLILYFSRTGEQYNVGVIDKGNTAIVAEFIQEKTGGDLFELKPADDHYPTTYDELTDIAKQEQNANARPAYAKPLPDLGSYDTIFIGSPVWWGDWPMLMYTFFEENADVLAGKTLIPFSTHAGSGLAGFDRKLAAVCTESTIGEGFSVAGSDAQNKPEQVREEVHTWLEQIGY